MTMITALLSSLIAEEVSAADDFLAAVIRVGEITCLAIDVGC